MIISIFVRVNSSGKTFFWLLRFNLIENYFQSFFGSFVCFVRALIAVGYVNVSELSFSIWAELRKIIEIRTRYGKRKRKRGRESIEQQHTNEQTAALCASSPESWGKAERENGVYYTRAASLWAFIHNLYNYVIAAIRFLLSYFCMLILKVRFMLWL